MRNITNPCNRYGIIYVWGSKDGFVGAGVLWSFWGRVGGLGFSTACECHQGKGGVRKAPDEPRCMSLCQWMGTHRSVTMVLGASSFSWGAFLEVSAWFRGESLMLRGPGCRYTVGGQTFSAQVNTESRMETHATTVAIPRPSRKCTTMLVSALAREHANFDDYPLFYRRSYSESQQFR